MNGIPIARLALTATEAPEALGVSDDFFREHVACELRWVHRGRKKLVALTELQRWLEESAARTLDDRKPSARQLLETRSPAVLAGRKERARNNYDNQESYPSATSA